jgi:hypothetical protein
LVACGDGSGHAKTRPHDPVESSAARGPLRDVKRQPDANQFPPKWSDGLALTALDKLDERINKADDDGFGVLSKGTATVEPKSCGQWLELHHDGYEAESTIEEQPDGFAKFRCGTLALLRHVRAAKRSFVREFVLDERALGVLPADLASAWSRDEEQAVAAASKIGKSLAAFNPAARGAINQRTRTFDITEIKGQPSSIMLAVEAWGDFDDDGDDDVVLSVINLSGGSAQQFRLLVLTRNASDAVLRVIKSGVGF